MGGWVLVLWGGGVVGGWSFFDNLVKKIDSSWWGARYLVWALLPSSYIRLIVSGLRIILLNSTHTKLVGR